MTDGVLVNWTPTTIADGIYYARFKPLSSALTGTFDWSGYLIRTSSKFAQAGVTDAQILTAVKDLVEAQRANLENTQGNSITVGGVTMDTLADVDNNSALSAEAKFDYKQRVICDDSLISAYNEGWTDAQVDAWQEDFAVRRKCYAAASNFLRELDIWEYIKDSTPPVGSELTALKERITRSVYFTLLSHDILLAAPCAANCSRSTTIANLKELVEDYANFTLGATAYAKAYNSDNAQGVFKTIGYAKKLGLVNDTYCAYAEGAAPGQCTNVNITTRVRAVTKKLYDAKVAAGWVQNPPTIYQTDGKPWPMNAWQRTGAAMALRINGDPAISSATRSTMYEIAAKAEAALIKSAAERPNEPLLGKVSSDTYQHLNNLFTISDWQPLTVPAVLQAIEDDGHTITANFREVYWNGANPIFNTTGSAPTKDTYVSSNIPAGLIGACGADKDFNGLTVNGNYVGLRGEPPSDALLTSLPAVRHIAQSLNTYLLPEVNGLTLTMATIAKNYPLDPDDEQCSGDPWFGANALISKMRHVNYMIVAYQAFGKYQVQAF